MLMKNDKDTEVTKLSRKIYRKVGKTIREQKLIVEGDRVLAGLSGGKDSMIMLESLANRKKSFPFPFELIAAHIIPENTGYKVNIDALENFCKNLEVPLIIRKIKPDLENPDKAPCFICSWLRRKEIFNLTRSLDCNKLAFGHHRDDALQTFLMNMLYHGSVSSLPYKLRMFEGRIHLIRPLLDMWEKDLKHYSELRNYRAVEKLCPFEDNTKRSYTADLLNKIEKDYAGSKRNMFHAMDNIYSEYLPSIRKSSN